MRASQNPIIVSFPYVHLAPHQGLPKCVYFDLYDSVHFDNVVGGNACSVIKQAHFSMVVELITALSPAPVALDVPPTSNGSGIRNSNPIEYLIVVGVPVFGVLIVMLLGILVPKCRHMYEKDREKARGSTKSCGLMDDNCGEYEGASGNCNQN